MAASSASTHTGVSASSSSENTLVGSFEPVYTVDLNLPHLERWKQIMSDKG